MKPNNFNADATALIAIGLKPGAVVANPMTSEDDLIVGGTGGTPTRLGKGSDGDVLTVDPGTHHLVWAVGGGSVEVKEVDGAPDVTGVTVIRVSNGSLTDDGGGQVTIDTGGGGTPADTVTDETTFGITPAAGVATTYSRGDHTHGSPDAPADLAIAIVCVIDGAASVIPAGVKLDLRIPFACTLTGWTLLADQSGSITIDVWRDTLANFPPTDADALPGSGKEPKITTATYAEDTTITDWVSDDIVAGDVLRFNVDSASSITRATLVLTGQRA